jgi:hypothetical protein
VDERFTILHQMDFAPSTVVSMLVGTGSVVDDSRIWVESGAKMNLAGELRVEFVASYTPSAGDDFRLIRVLPGGVISGSFDSVVLPTVPPGLLLELSEEFDGLYLNVVEDTSVCPADLTGDGVLNFFDVSAFLNAYNTMDPAADFTGDGVFNFFDVSGFLNAFNAGCP